ncbi:MAG TPA: carotenoid oxygenase family protein [Solirubrobacterales bacterium]|jgi:carotenoid cleavage dioxygenase-like enzyme|nr:carotenoid oxygenase family protein [Solirubrobacterales bacterium]
MTSTEAKITNPSKGFETLEDEVEVDELPLEGKLPAWLSGSLVRNGPAKFEVGEQRMRHWFDGLAMLHRFSFTGGRVSYASRYLQSRSYAEARRQGKIAYSEFATDPCRVLFSRVQSLFSPEAIPDNANINVAELGERMIAMTETAIPVEFDRETLAAAKAPLAAPGHLSTAHPHFDTSESKGGKQGVMLNYAVRLGPLSSYRFFSVDPATLETKVINSWPVAQPAYIHSFGMTERWLVLAEYPFVVNPARSILAGRPYIENYRWRPERGTRFFLMDRENGELRRGFKTEACFAFHHVNAFERDEEVVVDLCAFDDPRLIEDFYLDRLRNGKPVAKGKLRRYRLNLADRSVSSETLSEANIELPRINYECSNTRPYEHVWGVGIGETGFFDHLVKIELSGGEPTFWSEAGRFPGEPVFVANPGGKAEDDGVLLSVVLDAEAGDSFLLVLNASDLTELARARAPHHIPFGFHGQFSAIQPNGGSAR